MKKIPLFLVYLILFVLLYSCDTLKLKDESPIPEKVEITIAPKTSREYCYDTWDWEFSQALGATGMMEILEDEYLVFFEDIFSGFHELGHVVDYEGGMISDTRKFQQAVKMYLYFYSINPDQELFDYISQYYKMEMYGEIFAELYAYKFIGDFALPKIFEGFYAH